MELLIATLLMTASPGVQVHTLAGAPIEGRITALADESLTLATDAGEQSLQLKDVQAIVGGEMPSTTVRPGGVDQAD